jgi:hypothetical protein
MDTTRVTRNHCVKGTAGTLSLPDRRSEFESCECTIGMVPDSLLRDVYRRASTMHPGAVSELYTES